MSWWAERAPAHPRDTLGPTLHSEAEWVRRYLDVLGAMPAPPDRWETGARWWCVF